MEFVLGGLSGLVLSNAVYMTYASPYDLFHTSVFVYSRKIVDVTCSQVPSCDN